MDDFTFEKVMDIHRAVMEKSGGDLRLLSEANLHELVFRVNCTGNTLAKASGAAFLVAAFPPFRDGNKRTARGIMDFILSRDGYVIVGSEEELSALISGVVSFAVEQEDIDAWLSTNAQKNAQKS